MGHDRDEEAFLHLCQDRKKGFKSQRTSPSPEALQCPKMFDRHAQFPAVCEAIISNKFTIQFGPGSAEFYDMKPFGSPCDARYLKQNREDNSSGGLVRNEIQIDTVHS